MADARDDIARYAKGELTPAEMHALEKKALDDPFLADALEGASSVNPGDLDADLRQLHTLLKDRTREKKGGGPSALNWPLRIAAGLLLLAASTYIALYFAGGESTTRDSIVLNKASEEAQAPGAAATADSVAQTDKAVPAGDEPESAEEKEATGEDRDNVKQKAPLHEVPPAAAEKPAERYRTQQAPETAAPPAQPEAQEAQEAMDAETGSDLMQEEKVLEEVVMTEPAAKTLAEPAMKENRAARKKVEAEDATDAAPVQIRGFTTPGYAPAKTIQGVVTDADDGLPIPGVSVTAKGTDKGTTTDLNGNYQITLPEGEDRLVFSFIGMETREVDVPADNDDKAEDEEVNVQMTQDVSALSEVVVVGYGAEKSATEVAGWEPGEPEVGRKAYKDYLEKSLVYPEVAIKNEVEGKVSVQFTILPTGQLTDFRVVKSLGYGCDEELIRLIKQGPGWKPTKRDSEPVVGKGKVKIRFSLPKKK